MAALPLVAGALMVIALVAGLLNYFGNRTEHAWYVSFIAFVSWYFPFSIIVLVPLDLASTLYRNCKDEQLCQKPFLYVSGEFLVAAWRTIYWCSFALTWVLIPLLQTYTQSGEFTVMKRFRHAIRYNLIYQLIVGSIALLGLTYVWYSQGKSNVRAYVMALSNSYGLVLVVIFMGYGMVDIPRRLWHKGDNSRELRRISFQASVVKDKKQDTEDEVHNVARELSVVCHKVQLSDPLRPYVDKMVQDFPAVRGIQFDSARAVSPIPGSQGQRTDMSGATGAAMGIPRIALNSGPGSRKQALESLVPQVITEKYLADLHARIKRALRMNDRWTAIWHDLLKVGFLAQDIQENIDNPDKKFRSSLRPPTSKTKEWRLSIEWYWHLKWRSILLRASSVFCAILSLLIVWSEMTYQNINPTLSVIGLLVQLGRDRMFYGVIEAVGFFTMLYMCTCAYSTLMKMKLVNNYAIVPNHHTDEPTLLFFGSYLCRLTFPLVYNYLTISAVGKEDSTEFSEYMGKIDMVPFLGEFNYYMPYVILIPTLVTLFNVFTKMFAICSISDSFFDDDSDEGGIGGDVEEGIQVLKDARRDEERQLLSERGVNRDFNARRGATLEAYNNNKNRRRGGDSAAHSMLGEGSSASAWRDVRPFPTGSNYQRSFQEPYFDDSTDDDDEPGGGGLGRRDTFDPFGTMGGSRGSSAIGSARGSFESPSRLGAANPNRSPSQRNISKLDTQSAPGPLKSLWQKVVKPKQPISLDENTGSADQIDSDGARSSIESTSQADNTTRGGIRTYKPDRNALSTRTGPALMFASSHNRPIHDEDRDRLLSAGDSRIFSGNNGGHSSRAHSPQGRANQQPPTSSGRNNRPSSRTFGSSNIGNTGNTGNQRQTSPLVNI
ncbi:LMBR1 domain-containing protein 2 [Entomortierella beljakovae]|nr:LMBR1 domain-containing protein 2 [Entomortierella beljakovae]